VNTTVTYIELDDEEIDESACDRIDKLIARKGVTS
jgi:hypothetical protein